ncbi:uncharacterized protein LJ206_018850 [Theristicus caerulescens]
MQREQKRCPSSVPSNHLQSCHLPTFCWGPSQRDEASCSCQARSKVKALRSSPSQPRARAQGNLDTYSPGTKDMQRSDEERGAGQGGSVGYMARTQHSQSCACARRRLEAEPGLMEQGLPAEGRQGLRGQKVHQTAGAVMMTAEEEEKEMQVTCLGQCCRGV